MSTSSRDAASCGECAPDGHHCGPCTWAWLDEEHARIRRVRAWGLLGSLAACAAILAVGLATGSSRVGAVGAVGLMLTCVLAIAGWRAERRDRRAGVGSAVDPRFAAPPEARTRDPR